MDWRPIYWEPGSFILRRKPGFAPVVRDNGPQSLLDLTIRSYLCIRPLSTETGDNYVTAPFNNTQTMRDRSGFELNLLFHFMFPSISIVMEFIRRK